MVNYHVASSVKLLTLSVIAFVSLVSCSKYSREVEEALMLAGDNRSQLQMVLDHYESMEDTLGYQSAVFLLENMQGLGIKSSDSAELIPDITQISAGYLISNIDLALQNARYNLLNHNLNFGDFCEYILPYRLSHENLIDWRKDCLDKLNPNGKPRDIPDPQKMLYSINDSLRKGFQFSYKAAPAYTQNWQQLNDKRTGDCWAMSSTVVYPLRALGIPVSIDFVPAWGNINGGSHAWNVMINPDGSSSPFMGCESTAPGYGPFNIYYCRRKPPKVFRKTFSAGVTGELLAKQGKESFPSGLLVERSKDVTSLYVQTGDLTVRNSQLLGRDHAFVCVYSRGDWTPVYWAKINGETATFQQMATDVLYITCIYVDGQLEPVGCPCYISDETKSVVELCADFSKASRNNINAEYLQSKELDEQMVYSMPVSGQAFYDTMDSVKENRLRSRPKVAENYVLFYYHDGWKFHSRVTKRSGRAVMFESVPANTLYKILSGNSTGYERIFTYEQKKQVWW